MSATREQKLEEALRIAQPYVVGWLQPIEDGWIEKKRRAIEIVADALSTPEQKGEQNRG